MKNKLYLRILCLALGLLLLGGCAHKDTSSDISSEEQPSSSQASSDIASSDTSSVTEPTETDFGIPIVEESNTYGDLLAEIGGGKKLTALGELSDPKYADALSRLETALKGYSKEFSLVAYTLDNKKAVSFNAETELFPACTIKAFYSLYNCMEMDRGNGSLETEMEYKYEHRDPDWGTGDMKFSKYGTVFDLKTIITKSLAISDNVGYNMQVSFFGRDGYNKWVSGLGCPSLQIKPTVWALRTKADEHAVLWREIYRYLVNEESKHAEFLYSACTGTEGNFATKSLEGVKYSHKQGFNSGGGWHSMSDAGIVWKDGNPYIVVMLTNSQGITAAAQSVMDEAINIIHDELF